MQNAPRAPISEGVRSPVHYSLFLLIFSTERSFLLPYGHNFFPFNLKLFTTTLTELKAIAAPAIIGFNKNPLMG